MDRNQRDYLEGGLIAVYSPIVKGQAKTNAVIHCIYKANHRNVSSKQAAPDNLEHDLSRLSFSRVMYPTGFNNETAPCQMKRIKNIYVVYKRIVYLLGQAR